MPAKKYFTDAERKAAKAAWKRRKMAAMTEEQRLAYNARHKQLTRGTEELRLADNAREMQRTRGTEELRSATNARKRQLRRGTEELRRETNTKSRLLMRARHGTRTDLGRNLYVLKTTAFPGVYKVGRANDPARRAQEIAYGNFFRLHVILDYEGMGIHESEVHDALRAFQYNPENRLRTEWFKLPEEQLIATIRDIVSRYEH